MPGRERRTSGLPVDQGWSWVIMIGHFVMTLVMAGYGRALSLFLMEFVVMFQSSVATATLSYAVMTATFGIGNVVVTHVLLPRFDTRHVILTGATIGSVAIVGSSLAPTIVLIVFLHSVIGFSHAMMHTSSATLMGPYFQRRRGLANAVSNTGQSVSALVIPPLTQVLITSYGTRGALLLVAGLQMQAVVAGCLMRPVTFYAAWRGERKGKRTSFCRDRDRNSSNLPEGMCDGKVNFDGTTCELEERECSKDGPEKEGLLKGSVEKLSDHEESGELLTEPQRDSAKLDDAAQQIPCSEEVFEKEALLLNDPDEIALNERLKNGNGFEANVAYRNSSCRHEDENGGTPPCSTLQQFYAEDSVLVVDNQELQKADEVLAHVSTHKDTETNHKGDNCFPVESLSSKNSVRLEHGDFIKSAKEVETSEGLILSEEGKSCAKVSTKMTSFVSPSEEHSQKVHLSNRKGWRGACVTVTSKLVDVTLFRNWCFLLIITYFPFGQTNAFLAIFLPALGVERGLPPGQAALLLTVMGAVDLVSRLLLGALADTGLVRKTWIVATALAVLATACMMVDFYTTLGRLSAFSVVFGLCGGTNQNMLVVMVVELLGLPPLTPTLGLALLLQSLCLSVSHPILGALVDWTGSYAVVYYYVGVCLAIAVLVLLTEPLARKLESRRMRRMEEAKPNVR